MVGGFKYVLSESLFGEESHFGLIFFQIGWFNHQPVYHTFTINLSEHVGDNYTSPIGAILGDSNRRSFAQRVARTCCCITGSVLSASGSAQEKQTPWGGKFRNASPEATPGRGSLGFSLGCYGLLFFFEA